MAKKETIKEEGVSTGGDEPIKVEDKMIEVKKSDMDNILNRLSSYEKNIELLMKASDKERLARAMSKDGKQLVPTVKIAKWDDTENLVIGWKAITNKSEIINGRTIEDLTTLVFFEEAETITVPMLEFYRKTVRKEEADVIGREQKIDDRGNRTELLKVQFSNGKELIINSNFINL